MDNQFTENSNRAPQCGIIDLSSLGLFQDDRKGDSDYAQPVSPTSLSLVKLNIAKPTKDSSDEVDFVLRFSPEELSLLQARGRELLELRKAEGNNPTDLSTLSEQDRFIRTLQDFAIKSLSMKVSTLTPDHRGSDRDCISYYFNEFLAQDLNKIEIVANQLPRIDSNCKASICIPVAAHEEGSYIYRTLKSFTRQTADNSEFEIVLYLNHPTHNKEGLSVIPDNTIDEVAKFQRDFPNIRVYAFYSALPPEAAKIGLIRKFLTDVVLMRHYQRGVAAPELILIRADADTHGVKPEYIGNYLHLFQKFPNVDAFKGKLDWDWPGYLKDPVLLFGTRLFLALDAYIDATESSIGGGGANFAIRAARYADLGGYNPDSTLAEDVQLGSSLKSLRNGAKEHVAIKSAGARSRLWTDNRRGSAALKKGHAPVCQWHNGQTDFGAVNTDIRTVSQVQDGQSYLELLFASDFHERVSRVLQQTIDFYVIPADPKRKSYVENVLPKLGINASIDEKGTITLGDISGLIKWLQTFHEHAPSYWRDNLGFEI